VAISHMGRNNYIRRPSIFEMLIINKLNRFFADDEFLIDPAAPEVLMLELLNRVEPVIRNIVRLETAKLINDKYQPEGIQDILDELESMRIIFKDNEEIINRILDLETMLEGLSSEEIDDIFNEIVS